MTIKIYPKGLRIKSYADVEKFLGVIKNNKEFYYSTKKEDFQLNSTCNGIILTNRAVSERGNVFAPYSEVIMQGCDRAAVVMHYIWKHRKYINKKLKELGV